MITSSLCLLPHETKPSSLYHCLQSFVYLLRSFYGNSQDVHFDFVASFQNFVKICLRFYWDIANVSQLNHLSQRLPTDNQTILWCASVWNAKWAWPNLSRLFDDLGIKRSWFIWCLTIYTRYKYLHISIRCIGIAGSMLTKCCN